MEIKNNKANRVFRKIIAGMVILLCFTFVLIVPNILSLFVIGKIVISAICFIGVVSLYNGAVALYIEHNNKKTKLFKNLSIIGMLLYAIVLVCWAAVFISNTELTGTIESKFAYYLVEAVERHVWLSRIRDLYVLVLIIFNLVLCVCVFKALVSAAALDDKMKKKVRLLELFNLVSCILCVYLFMEYIERDMIFNPICLLFLAYLIWLCLCISHMREYIAFSNDTNNGSIFNRIPEDEYQEFLAKMK